jgi:dTDP-4-dehydrorhamnose reductase
MQSTVLIIGAQGMIGCQLVPFLQQKGYTVLSPTKEELDVTNVESVKIYFESNAFDYIVHLAAYTAVDRAEIEREACYLLNITATEYLYNASTQKGVKFIFISTDFVFDGTKPPYTETSSPNALGVYGKTKWEAEEIVKSAAAIVRISYPYGQKQSVKKDIVHSIADALREGKTLHMVSDSIFTPTFTGDILQNIESIIVNFVPGIYHSVGATSLSPYGLALAIADVLNVDKAFVQKTTFESFYKGKASRPQFMEILSSKDFKSNSIPQVIETLF